MVATVLALVVNAGCKRPPAMGQVRGVVTLNGKPLDMVRVLFMPDPTGGNTGPHSECLTGKDGSYDLIFSRDAEQHGAIAGAHRVVIEDTAAEESRGEFRANRVPKPYRTSAQTPLRFEVQPGEQTIDIELNPKGR